ncbi:MAG: RNA methyltransferase [Candidatus Subteraquimicrobiales bacterium]|nr:RNA methyltransferase [Candidatus Subteraquimicrobiales bacterium]
MTQEKIITSLENARVKNVIKLRDKKGRDSLKLMIIDGYRAINLALNNGFALKELFYCEKFFNSRGERILIERTQQNGARIFHLSEKVFKKIAYGDNPEGVLAITGQVKKSLADLPLGKSALFVVLESVEKPGNLGAILRSADSVGAKGIIVCDNQTDIYNPNVIRSSRGTFFTVPVVEATSRDAIQWLKQNQVKIIVSTPMAKVEYYQLDYKDSCAIVLGSEDKGISSAWQEAAGFKIKIPMRGQADSLNVSIAAAVILYEALRQRNAKN